MATVVGVMDRSWWTARTDVNVLVDPKARALTWIPRDLYVPSIKDRINSAFGGNRTNSEFRGDHARYVSACAEMGFPSDHSVVVLPASLKVAFGPAEVVVPVERHMKYRYPLKYGAYLEDGSKVVEFHPPEELLFGERIHQWIGARTWAGGDPRPPLPDLDRISRQMVFVRCLLESGFDFSAVPTSGISVSDPGAYDDLRLVEASWTLSVFEAVRPVRIDEMDVLLKADGGS